MTYKLTLPTRPTILFIKLSMNDTGDRKKTPCEERSFLFATPGYSVVLRSQVSGGPGGTDPSDTIYGSAVRHKSLMGSFFLSLLLRSCAEICGPVSRRWGGHLRAAHSNHERGRLSPGLEFFILYNRNLASSPTSCLCWADGE